MEINREYFIKQLKFLNNAIGRNTSLFAGIDCIAFHNGKLAAYNAAMSMTIDIENMDIKGCIHASEFIKLLDKMKGEKILLEQDESGLLCKCGRSKPTFAWKHDTLITYIDNRVPTTDYEPIPDDFMESLSKVMIKGNKQEVAGVFIHNDMLISTNMQTIVAFQKLSHNFNADIWLSQANVESLLRCKLPFSHIAFQQQNKMTSVMYFKCDGYEVGVSLLNTATWVERGILANAIGGKLATKDGEREFAGLYNCAGEASLLGKVPSELIDVVGRAEVMSAKEGVPALYLQFANDRINVRADSENGKFAEAVDLVENFAIEGHVEDTYAFDSILNTLQAGQSLRYLSCKVGDKDKMRLIVEDADGYRACIQPVICD